MSARRRAGLGLALAAAAAAGCVSGPAPRDHFYRLEAGAPAARAAQPRFAGIVEVDRLRADPLTDQLPLLYRGEGPEIHRHAYHRWAAPPSAMVQSALIGFLRASGVAATVVSPEARARPDLHVTGRLMRLERLLGSGTPQVVIELELGASDGQGELLLLQTYRTQREVPSDAVDDAVVALEGALTEIFERFVADLEGAEA